MSSIFISVANYRDQETAGTVQSLIRNSTGNHKLTIVVLSQLLETDHVLDLTIAIRSHVEVKNISVSASKSFGPCWARSEIQRHYSGQDYYLQIDSHVELVECWDAKLIDQHSFASKGGPAVLSAYLPGYRLVDGERVVDNKSPTEFRLRMGDGIPTATARIIEPRQVPVETFFFGAGFAFSTGDFVDRVPYDAELFFLGEEISMAIRAYTNGYSLYCPGIYFGAHLYRRSGGVENTKPLFWDADLESRRKVGWKNLDRSSRQKVIAICSGEWSGRYGIADSDRYQEFKRRVEKTYGIDIAGPGLVDRAGKQPSPGDNLQFVRSKSLRTTGRLAIVGVGISAIAQMTLEAIAEIEAADIVFYNPTSPVMAAKLNKLNANCYNLYRLYGEGKHRRTTYIQMAELMLREVRRKKHVVGVFHGHPGFFVSASRRAIVAASAEGFYTRMVPGVSSIDNLCAELGVDPGTFGMQILKASTVLKRDAIVATDSHVIIVQVGAVGDSSFSFSGFKNTRSKDFFLRLISLYSKNQEAVYYKAPTVPGFSAVIWKHSLEDFIEKGILAKLHGGSLYLPPKGVLFEEMSRLQISKGTRRDADRHTPAAALSKFLPLPIGFRESISSKGVLDTMETLVESVDALEAYKRDPVAYVTDCGNLSKCEADALCAMDLDLLRSVGTVFK